MEVISPRAIWGHPGYAGDMIVIPGRQGRSIGQPGCGSWDQAPSANASPLPIRWFLRGMTFAQHGPF